MDRKTSGLWRYGDRTCIGLWDILEPLTRFWGVATSVVMCGVGVELAVYHNVAGVYILIGAGVVFFLELTWVVTLFMELCTRNNEYTSALRCWDAVSCCRSSWPRVPLYSPPALVLLLYPRWFWLVRLSGAMLLALALLHLLGCATARHRHPLLYAQHHHHLVTDGNSECAADRYDDLTEVVDDSFPSTDKKNTSNHNITIDEASSDEKDENVIIEI